MVSNPYIFFSSWKTQNEKGQTIVEFTVVFLFFLLFVFIIIEAARAIFAFNTAGHAAREGVRYAIVRGSTSTCPGECPASAANIENYVRGKAVGVDLKTVDVCWWENTPDCQSDPHNPEHKTPGSTVQVRVEVDYNPVLPLVPSGVIPLSSTSHMVISN